MVSGPGGDQCLLQRGVQRRESEGVASTLRIDLYKRGCFILEAKQGSEADRAAADKGEDDLSASNKQPAKGTADGTSGAGGAGEGGTEGGAVSNGEEATMVATPAVVNSPVIGRLPVV
mgnify:CR=1 FL=1